MYYYGCFSGFRENQYGVMHLYSTTVPVYEQLGTNHYALIDLKPNETRLVN
jgi:hypothetical protein